MSRYHKELLCPSFKGIARAKDEEKNIELIAQLRCKMWSCEYCAAANAKQWRAAITHYIANSDIKTWSFHTITMPRWLHNASDSEDELYELSCGVIRKHWDKFMKRLKREYGKFQYVRVVEQHQSGAAHIHLLASFNASDIRTVTRRDGSTYSYSKAIKGHAVECGFGYIIDNRNIANEGDEKIYHVAAYVTKYMTKDLIETDQTRKKWRVRKIQTSRAIKRLNFDTEREWVLKSGVMVDEFVNSDSIWFDVTRGKPIVIESFRGGIAYPPLQKIDED